MSEEMKMNSIPDELLDKIVGGAAARTDFVCPDDGTALKAETTSLFGVAVPFYYCPKCYKAYLDYGTGLVYTPGITRNAAGGWHYNV